MVIRVLPFKVCDMIFRIDMAFRNISYFSGSENYRKVGGLGERTDGRQ